MANPKTILSIEVFNRKYTVKYSGGFRPDWNHLSETERKTVLRHDGNIMEALIHCPELFERLSGFVRSVERFKRRESKKSTTGQNQVKTR